MSPASGDLRMVMQNIEPLYLRFHSINVPSEWGREMELEWVKELADLVSIQLMSPASGDLANFDQEVYILTVSIQLMSPASGDLTLYSSLGLLFLKVVSIQLMSPASGDYYR